MVRKSTSDVIRGVTLDAGELAAAFIAVRAHANSSKYGKFISDDECKAVAAEVVAAIENYRNGTII